jgi:hypothetical protein
MGFVFMKALIQVYTDTHRQVKLWYTPDTYTKVAILAVALTNLRINGTMHYLV